MPWSTRGDNHATTACNATNTTVQWLRRAVLATMRAQIGGQMLGLVRQALEGMQADRHHHAARMDRFAVVEGGAKAVCGGLQRHQGLALHSGHVTCLKGFAVLDKPAERQRHQLVMIWQRALGAESLHCE